MRIDRDERIIAAHSKASAVVLRRTVRRIIEERTVISDDERRRIERELCDVFAEVDILTDGGKNEQKG